MPDPASYSSEDEFMEACVSTMVDEGKPQDQAVAACMQMWHDRNKAASQTVTIGVGGVGAAPSVDRAWSTLTIKSIDAEQRVIEGLATTPTVDRIGDVVDPMGAKFTLPIPLLHHHKHDQPVGHVVAAKAGKDGISIRAQLAKVAEPGALKDRVELAWQEIKAGLVRGLSIGFKPIEYEPLDAKDPFGGLRFSAWNWFELSLVTIPANTDAQISVVRSIDQGLQAADGTGSSRQRVSGGNGSSRQRVSAPVNLKRKERDNMSKTLADQIADLRATRAAKAARMEEVLKKSIEDGRSTDQAEQDEFDELQRTVEAIDADLKRFEALERTMVVQAKPVPPASTTTIEDGAAARAGMIRVRDVELPPGVRLARVARCLALAQGNRTEALRIGERMYGSDAPTLGFLRASVDFGEVSDLAVKAVVPAGSTTDTQWAGALVTAVSGEAGVVGDFLEFLKPMTFLGQFGANGVPSLRRVPFRTGLITQHSEGTGYWVGEGQPKPVTKVDLSRRTLTPTKVANIAVVTDELMRDASPSADVIIRDSLVASLSTRINQDFIDPAITASGARPASITNGITAQTSFSAGGSVGGGTALAMRRDIARAADLFLDANFNAANLVWLMRTNTALKASMIVNSLGEPDALVGNLGPSGGTLAGIRVITSNFVPASASPTGDYVVLLDAQSIWFADEGGFTIDFSREASVAMEDAPSGAAFTGSPGSVTTLSTTALVSLWQENLVGWRAERTLNWLRARTNGVVVIESVNWGE